LEDERTQEAVRSLIELYEHTDNLEQARKYRSLTRHEKLP
jgi:hypothetical protein